MRKFFFAGVISLILLLSLSAVSQEEASGKLMDRDMVLFFKIKGNIDYLKQKGILNRDLESGYNLLSSAVDKLRQENAADRNCIYLISSEINSLYDKSSKAVHADKIMQIMYFIMIVSGIVIILTIVAYSVYISAGRK